MYMLLCIMIAYNVMQGAKMKKSELIFNNIPFKNLECYNAQKTIENIVKFLRGEKLYFYDKWHKNGSHFRLSKTGFTASVMRIMSDASVNFEFGNDAPKGGATGDFIRIKRTNSRITSEFISLIESKLNHKLGDCKPNENPNFKANI